MERVYTCMRYRRTVAEVNLLGVKQLQPGESGLRA